MACDMGGSWGRCHAVRAKTFLFRLRSRRRRVLIEVIANSHADFTDANNARPRREFNATAMAAATEPKGDIISTYPKMVSSYVVVQLVSYVCSLLSTFGVRGATATAVAAHLAPIETTLCQMMFMTTMHNGPVSDGRLINVCRVGFLIDGIVLFVGSATVFRPESVADAVAAVNLTAIGGTPNNTSGLIGGIIWFIALGVIPGWLGVNMLTLIRRRLLERPGLGAFCDQATRAFLCLMVVQVVVSISTLVPLALATGVEAEIRGRKIVGCASNVNFMVPLLFGMKLAFFDTTGTTVAHWLTCGPTRRIPTSLNVGVSMVILHFLITVIPFVLLLGAASTTATAFAIHDLLAQGIYTAPMFAAFFCAAILLGGGRELLGLDMDAAERRRQTTAPADTDRVSA